MGHVWQRAPLLMNDAHEIALLRAHELIVEALKRRRFVLAESCGGAVESQWWQAERMPLV